MRHFLLLGLMAAATFGMSAQVDLPTAQKKAVVQERVAVGKGAPKYKRLPSDVIVGGKDGKTQLRKNLSSKLQAPVAKAIAKAQAPEGSVLYENFEGYDGYTMNWLPDGWTLEHKGDCSEYDTWMVLVPNPWYGYPSAIDGDFICGIMFSDDYQDEWLISPKVTVGDNMELSYYMNLDPMFFYVLDSTTVDWDNNEFIGEKQIAFTIQVLVKAEGDEDWTVLRNYADEYLEYSLSELWMMSSYELKKNSVSLGDYSGKEVQVAFRYVGTDGQSQFLDAICIGQPALEGVCYMNPANTLFFGYSSDEYMSYLTKDIALYPVNAPLAWINYSDAEATFEWTYSDPQTGDIAISDDQDILEVTYEPDYSSKETMRNNLIEFPTLSASAPGASSTSYTAPYDCFQAGGKSEFLSYGEIIDFTLLPYATNAQGTTELTVRDDKLGAWAVPVFGYSEFSNDYWLNYSLNGENKIDGDYANLIGIANIFFPSADAPLVVNGISVFGFGRFYDDAELTATIYALNENMSTNIETFTVVARATITGKDIITDGFDGSKGDLCLPFKFDKPAIVQASDEHPVFAFMLEGFNSDKVDYWDPYISNKPDEFGMSFGYTLNHIDLSNHGGRENYYSFRGLSYCENGTYDDYIGSFAIGLDAEYPWLTADAEKVEFGTDETTATVALGSYYDGSKLTVEAPEGIVAKVEGRYNECVLTLTREAGAPVDGNVIVSGPGVEVELPVVAPSGSTGLEEIDVNAEIDAVYDLSGRKVVAPEAGIYVVKYSDGKVRKVTVK